MDTIIIEEIKTNGMMGEPQLCLFAIWMKSERKISQFLHDTKQPDKLGGFDLKNFF